MLRTVLGPSALLLVGLACLAGVSWAATQRAQITEGETVRLAQAETAPPPPSDVPVATPKTEAKTGNTTKADGVQARHEHRQVDYWSMLFVFVLASFIGMGVISRVSRLLHTPLMSLTNAISAIAVVGAIIVAGTEGYPPFIRFLGAVALFASMTNIVSGFLITDRMLKMFKQTREGTK